MKYRPKRNRKEPVKDRRLNPAEKRHLAKSEANYRAAMVLRREKP